MRLAELAGTLSWFSERRQDLAIQIHPDQLSCEAVHHVDVLLADVEAARQPLVFDFPDERSVLLEDLDTLILPIRNPQQTLGVDIDAVRDLELTRPVPLPPHDLMNVPSLLNLMRARRRSDLSVSLHDEDVAAIGNDDVVGLIELAGAAGLVPLAGFSSCADRQQRLPVAVHLDHDMAADVGGPEVALPVDAQAMRAGKQFVTESANECAVAIELEKRFIAAGQDEQMPVGIEGNAAAAPIVIPAGSVTGVGATT